MPLDGTTSVRFRPRSLSDTLDASNSQPGACSNLANLIADPSTLGCMQCRPAAVSINDFSGFNTPGVISVAFQTGTRIYGLIGTARNAGKDEPFVYDLVSGSFITVSGITAANCPATQPTTGDWVPPTMDMVGTQIYVTHPGFTGTANAFFGIFDVSGFTETITGDIVSGSPLVRGNPDISGVFGGMPISGVGIPANTLVLNKANIAFDTPGTTHSNTTIDGILDTSNMFVGQSITGVGIPSGVTIASIIDMNSITISQAAIASATIEIFITGTQITLSANATANTNALAISIAGGSAAAPLWTASNTTGAIALAQPPTNVRQFNNRAEFSQAQYLIFTDTLSTNCTNATQILTVGDTAPITALCPLTMVTTQGAVLQSLLIFKENLISQLNGDPTTNNLALNDLSPAGVGTSSSRSVSASPNGVIFVDNDGVRLVTQTGNVTDPLPDVRVPFIYALNRSRISGDYSNDVYRVCLQNGNVSGNPFQEFWYDFKYKQWTGPHTFQQSMVVAYKATFIAFSNSNPHIMYQSDPVQNSASTFTENGSALLWTYATAPLPDEDQSMMNSALLTSINMSFKTGTPLIACTASDELTGVLSQATIIPSGTETLWGAFTWGAALWFGIQFGLAPFLIPWTTVLVFSRVILQFNGTSSLGFRIGNINLTYQPLGYPVALSRGS